MGPIDGKLTYKVEQLTLKFDYNNDSLYSRLLTFVFSYCIFINFAEAKSLKKNL